MKKIFSVVLALVMVAGLAPTFAPPAVASESDYVFDPATGTITGYTGTGGDITIPGTIGGVAVTVLGPDAFRGHTSITSVIIPEGVTTNGGAFSNNPNLKSISIPASLTIFTSADLLGADNLENIIVDSANPNYMSENGVLYNKTQTRIYKYTGGKADTTFSFPASVNAIHGYAFRGSKNLTSLTIPDSVTYIPQWVFTNCSGLTSINIPIGVTHIEFGAFQNCSNLKKVYALRPTPPTFGGTNVFTGVFPTCTLCVINAPAIDAYTASDWNGYFTGRIMVCPTSIDEIIRNSAINIYPNPTRNDFTVSFDVIKPTNVKIVLTDLSGREVLDIYDGFVADGMFRKAIKTTNLVNSIYFLNILIDGYITAEKIIIE
ncbi:MAG: leucine-rich repeat protein [Candidatus Cloacimonetes bacterium]|nr:leucine-rich repeat protein [Candidatus Cloacimonadota bacterium]